MSRSFSGYVMPLCYLPTCLLPEAPFGTQKCVPLYFCPFWKKMPVSGSEKKSVRSSVVPQDNPHDSYPVGSAAHVLHTPVHVHDVKHHLEQLHLTTTKYLLNMRIKCQAVRFPIPISFTQGVIIRLKQYTASQQHHEAHIHTHTLDKK